jgi:hypothetical protein
MHAIDRDSEHHNHSIRDNVLMRYGGNASRDQFGQVERDDKSHANSLSSFLARHKLVSRLNFFDCGLIGSTSLIRKYQSISSSEYKDCDHRNRNFGLSIEYPKPAGGILHLGQRQPELWRACSCCHTPAGGSIHDLMLLQWTWMDSCSMQKWRV